MKKQFHKFLNTAGKNLISFCLAYGAIITIGRISLLFFGEPDFPEA